MPWPRGPIASTRWQDWRWQLGNSPRTLSELGEGTFAGTRLEEVTARYPFRVTPYYLSLVQGDRVNSPISLQCMPSLAELDEDGAGRQADPFQENAHSPVPGLVRRFKDRALVLSTTRCAVRCRHCTRKNTLRNQESAPFRARFLPMLEYLRHETAIREVIVSGGDPFLIEDDRLDWMLTSLRRIEHIEVVRMGTRVPVVLPMRVTPDLCDLLAAHRPLWVNTQFNHPAELTDDAIAACEGLLARGIPVSNQAVLMRGVNDSTEVMRALCSQLQRHMIRPYYVFLCDPIMGISHFRVGPAAAFAISETLRESLGGLALPRFVADIPGAAGKVPVERLITGVRGAVCQSHTR